MRIERLKDARDPDGRDEDQKEEVNRRARGQKNKPERRRRSERGDGPVCPPRESAQGEVRRRIGGDGREGEPNGHPCFRKLLEPPAKALACQSIIERCF